MASIAKLKADRAEKARPESCEEPFTGSAIMAIPYAILMLAIYLIAFIVLKGCAG
jgi:hypothetical protein